MIEQMETKSTPKQSPKNSKRWLILVVGLLLAVIIAGGGIAYALLSLPNKQQNVYNGPCTANSPYGFTTINADDQLVQDYKQLNVCWVRFQIREFNIEKSPGQFNWTALDQAVKTMNDAGIHLNVPLECFRPVNGGKNDCFNKPYIPTPDQMANFATQIAQRYDGNHGHGKIDAFEILNEEGDFLPQPDQYCPLLQAGYKAIKDVYPDAKVGMYGTFRSSLKHVQAVFDAVKSCSNSMDYANIHYYARGDDPSSSTNAHPSLPEALQAIHDSLPGKPVWITETGWSTTQNSESMNIVSPDQQASYMKYVFDTAAQDKLVQRVFWFTINYGKQAASININGQPLPAFSTMQQYIKEHPFWTNN